MDQLFYAVTGHGAFLIHKDRKKRIFVSDKSSLSMFTFGFSASIDFIESNKSDDLVKTIRDKGSFQHFRRRMFESTAYELCCVANGSFDAYFNSFFKIWDIAAGEVIAKEAGGNISYFQDKNSGESHLLASNGIIHSPLTKIIEDNFI